MKLLALAGVLVLAGCASQEQRAEILISTFGPFCEKLGYERNTDAWRGCIASEGSNRGAVRVVR